MQPCWAIGLMSGTSMDGIDAALIKTNGTAVTEFGPAVSLTYTADFRNRFRQYLGAHSAPEDIIDEFTDLNAAAVKAVMQKSGLNTQDIRVIGFHGQTLFHDAPAGITVQVGNGTRLATQSGIEVVSDFRRADVAAGGQGAPFAPLYHQALAQGLTEPLVVLNLGGVANVTYINGDEILAFDTGPASALLDDWIFEKTGEPFDQGGQISRAGHIDNTALARLLDHAYFDKQPPKSLDRDDFSKDAIAHLSVEDGAATLSAFTIKTIQKAQAFMQIPPKRWLVTGGGRHNGYFMEQIAAAVGAPVEPVEAVGWRGDELEAEAFAFLAVRSLNALPLSLPTTTGVKEPMLGGVRYPYEAA
jgi:anhydro-N-acetylmuramic acid kinase